MRANKQALALFECASWRIRCSCCRISRQASLSIAQRLLPLTVLVLFVSLSFAAAPAHNNPLLNSTISANTTAGNLTAFNQTTADADNNKNEANI
jgi:hypothetical protein